MKPFRKNVAIAIDGGGIKGIIAVKALAMLEKALSMPLNNLFRLAAGTSTGSIISAGLSAGMSAGELYDLYIQLGQHIFRPSLRSKLWPLTRYRFPGEPLREALEGILGNMRMGDYWQAKPRVDVVITAYDLVENRTRFIKPWKDLYTDWPVTNAVMASSAVPTYFPVVDGRYVDGGLGSYSNPCYVAAYEAFICLGWKPEETTLLSLGTGRGPNLIRPGAANRFFAWDWLKPALGAFLTSADDQQVHLVATFFKGLDFRRVQVDLNEEIGMAEPDAIPLLSTYGERMGTMILRDQVDSSVVFVAQTLTGGLRH